jgi:hypothetical protein
LKYFHLTFLPRLFPSLGITNSAYSLFSSDLSYLSNSPCILVFAFVIGAYLLVGLLSSKRFIKNKMIRKIFKSIRKNRMKYSIIHDAFWICYIYAVYISMLQFKMGSFNGTSNILNMVLAILTLITFLAFTYFVFKLGYKYRKEPDVRTISFPSINTYEIRKETDLLSWTLTHNCPNSRPCIAGLKYTLPCVLCMLSSC